MFSTCEPNNLDSKTLTDALELCFRRFGDSVAIDAPGFTMTYAKLDEKTRHVASELRSRLSEQELKSKPVAILMSRSIELYVAQIAVLRSGGFFVPIDPVQPAERIEFLLSDSCASLLLVREADSFTAGQSAVVPLSIDARRWTEECHDREQQSSVAESDGGGKVDENDFAYMIYTSGSTGRPKGVPISHRSICNLCRWWSEEFEIAPGDRTLQMMSVGFDASLEEILPTLVTGGVLVPMQSEAMSSMEQFLGFVARQNIQHLHLPTAFWHALSASIETHESLKLPPSVQTVVLGGEKVNSAMVKAWFSQVGTEVRLINAYGPTETTVVASYALLSPGVQPSIGKPIHGVSFSVCDKDGQPVEADQPGELYIGGVGVAAGYWNRKELSAEKFVDYPDNRLHFRTGDLVRLNKDGNYEFVGRIDNQIKLRGYRIEPGEIANCLKAHPQVSQAHVLAGQLSQDGNAQHLIGYVICKSGVSPNESELREFLSQRLPAYMVPTRIIAMESFPVAAGGKLDVARFPSPSENMVSSTDQEDEPLLSLTEQKIGKIWKKVLGVSQLGPQANFFLSGGDSLLAMRLVLLLESEFPGPVIPVSALIPNPTIAAMAEYISRRERTSPAAELQNWPLLTRLASGQQPIAIVCIHAAGGGGVFYRQLFEGIEEEASVAVLESAILHQEKSLVQENRSIAEMARDYVECLIDAGCDRKLTLVGYSFGSLIAVEMALLLKAQGYVVDKIINIDCPNPQKMKSRNSLSRFWFRLRSREALSERISECRMIMRRKRRIRELERLEMSDLPLPVELRPLALELMFGAITQQYIPKFADVSMHLLKCEYPVAKYLIPEDYGWTEMVADLTTVEVRGGHNSIFNQPYLELLIKLFREALAK